MAVNGCYFFYNRKKFNKVHPLELETQNDDLQRKMLEDFDISREETSFLAEVRQGKFIYIAHFIHNGNSKRFT